MTEQSLTFDWEVKNFDLCAEAIYYEIANRFFTVFQNNEPWAKISRVVDDPEGEYSFFFFVSCKSAFVKEMLGTIQLIAKDGKPYKEMSMTHIIDRYSMFGVKHLMSKEMLETLRKRKETLHVRCYLRNVRKNLKIETVRFNSSKKVQKISQEWKVKFSQVEYGRTLKKSVNLVYSDSKLDVSISTKGRGDTLIFDFTRNCNAPEEPLILNTRITVLDVSGIETEIWKQDVHRFSEEELIEVWQFPTFISKSQLIKEKDKFFNNGFLRLKCEIVTSCGHPLAHKLVVDSAVVEVGPSTDCLAEDMKKIHNSTVFADVQIHAVGERVDAHKVVLQVRSQKFAEMLEGMENDILYLTDVNTITLKRMVRYMYTDELDDLDYGDAVDAYIAAHIYRIASLKCKCAFLLQSHMDVNNVCSILSHAIDCCDYDLKKCAVDFIKRYWGAVCLSKEWASLTKERRYLAQTIKEEF